MTGIPEAEPGLRVLTGDSPYVLIDHLARVLFNSPLSPLEDDIIVVQSLGMERWIRQQLAVRHGCAASLNLPFPSAFCRGLSQTIQPGQVIDGRFEEAALTWRLNALLGDETLLREPVHEPLRRFLSGADGLKRYGLARRIGARFDEYRLYRPDMLLDWEADNGDGSGGHPDNPHAAWQRSLWLRLLNGERPQHFARWFLSTIEQLGQVDSAPRGLPSRVSVFGVSTLPPLFVRLLKAFARFVPVHFHVLVPDASTWRRDAASDRHPLFEQFGSASRDLLTMLDSQVSEHDITASSHVAGSFPHDDTLLHHVQRTLRTPAADGRRYAVARNDRSLSVHICHSPLRELEVLRDCLFDAFAADPSLRPHDILVMVPSVDLYAPFVERIFGSASGDGGFHIPFRVADRTLNTDSESVQAFLLLLELATSRLAVGDVLRLLALPPVRRTLNMTEAQVERAGQAAVNAAIRWGWDGADRAARHSLPAFEENSWRWGLDRLLVGYATGPIDSLVEGLLPVAGDLADDAEVIGLLADWAESLADHLRTVRMPRTLREWPAVLEDVLAWLIKPDGAAEHRAREKIAGIIRTLNETMVMHTNGIDSVPVTLEVIRDWLRTVLSSEERDAGFLAGGITVCAMKPMRAVPHRVIAMLGLDNASFPRNERRPAFDLIGTSGRVGDRDPRADDRQLVLDTLLCAGDRLHISYVGRSQTNNAGIAPSIVIAELQRYLDTVVRHPGDSTYPRLCVEHRLQPYSAAYFSNMSDEGSPLFSYDAKLAKSVKDAKVRVPAPAFVTGGGNSGIVAPMKSWQPSNRLVASIDDLMNAWSNPSEFHARRVLQLKIRKPSGMADDTEMMEPDLLARTRVRQRLLDHEMRRHHDAASLDVLLLKSGELPPGPVGEAWLRQLRKETKALLKRVDNVRFAEPLTVNLQGHDEQRGWLLTGYLGFQLDNEQWMVRAATIKAKDRVRAWIAHVARSALGVEGPTRLIGLDQENTFGSIAEPQRVLDVLMAGYRDILSRPVPYFTGAAEAYRKAVGTGAGKYEALKKARKSFISLDNDFGSRADLDDPYVALLWRGRDPFETHREEFIDLTNGFWGPLEGTLQAISHVVGSHVAPDEASGPVS